MKNKQKGRGLVSNILQGVGTTLNTGIDLLPWELHMPSGLTNTYNYCGPGTRLQERLARGDKGINQLDDACKAHDIAYAQYSDNARRAQADKELAERAWKRFKASDSSIGEKAAAWVVTTAMKAKAKLGGGKQKNINMVKRKKLNSQQGKGLYLRPFKSKGLSKKNIKTGNSQQGKGLYLRPYKGEGLNNKKTTKTRKNKKKKTSK